MAQCWEPVDVGAAVQHQMGLTFGKNGEKEGAERSLKSKMTENALNVAHWYLKSTKTSALMPPPRLGGEILVSVWYQAPAEVSDLKKNIDSKQT